MADVEEPVVEAPAEEAAAEIPAEEEDEFVAVGGATEVKLFGKWSFDDIEVRDISLVVSRLHFVWDFFILANETASNICPLLMTLITGLSCLQGRPCNVSAPHSGTIPKEAFPQGILPHCGASCLLLDEKGSQLGKEAHGMPNCSAHS